MGELRNSGPNRLLMNTINVIGSNCFESFSHHRLQDENMTAYCVRKEDVCQLKNTGLSNSSFSRMLICDLCSPTFMQTLLFPWRWHAHPEVRKKNHSDFPASRRVLQHSLRASRRWKMVGLLQRAICSDYGDPEGRRRASNWIGQRCNLVRAPGTTANYSSTGFPLPPCWKEVWQWRAIGGTHWRLHRVSGS